VNLNQYSITLSGQWLSDMFFNFRHDNYERVVNDTTSTMNDLREAVKADAIDFITNIPADQYQNGLVDALVEDFFSRL
jgi:hypothetical protein